MRPMTTERHLVRRDRETKYTSGFWSSMCVCGNMCFLITLGVFLFRCVNQLTLVTAILCMCKVKGRYWVKY